jgi:hypothetical protein
MTDDFTCKVRRRHMPGRDHRTSLTFVLFFLLPIGSFAQELLRGSAELVIADCTPVKLRLAQTISSAHLVAVDRFDLKW